MSLIESAAQSLKPVIRACREAVYQIEVNIAGNDVAKADLYGYISEQDREDFLENNKYRPGDLRRSYESALEELYREQALLDPRNWGIFR